MRFKKIQMKQKMYLWTYVPSEYIASAQSDQFSLFTCRYLNWTLLLSTECPGKTDQTASICTVAQPERNYVFGHRGRILKTMP